MRHSRYFRKEWNKTDFAQTITTFVVMGLRLYCGNFFWLLPLPMGAEGEHNCVSEYMHAKKGGFADAAIVCMECDHYNDWARSLYAVITVTVWLRLFDLVRASKSVGQMTLIFFRMIGKDVYVFFFLILIISPGFGIAFAALQPADNFKARDISQMAYNLDAPFFAPLWAVLGEYDLGSMIDVTDTIFPANTILPLLLFVYLGLTTVVLINLLIAQMCATTSEGSSS